MSFKMVPLVCFSTQFKNNRERPVSLVLGDQGGGGRGGRSFRGRVGCPVGFDTSESRLAPTIVSERCGVVYLC